ncbi:methyl-accepting chemotaxis protein [Desulfobacterales bacterium HSG2]|nr:methyl-accepting chemotaxis protein [Desulfobacterales bacterium HSG2]
MTFIIKKSFGVRGRLFFAFFASVLAVLVVGFIAWGGFKKGHTEILAFQDEDIPRLKNSLHLSELGMALESFSLIIPKAANSDELDSHRENLKKRMAEIEKQIQLLSDIQDRISEKSGEYNVIKEHIVSVNNIRSDLGNNLNDLLEITRNMIELEDKRKVIFSHISKYKDSIRKKFRKKIDATNTQLQLHIQEVRDISTEEEGSGSMESMNALVVQVDTLRNVMNALADSEKISGFLSVAASSQNSLSVKKMFALFNSDLPVFMGKVSRIGYSALDKQIKADMKALAKTGIGEDGIFKIREQQFEARKSCEALTAEAKTGISTIRDNIGIIVEIIDEENKKSGQETLEGTDMAIRHIIFLIIMMITVIAVIGFFTIRSISLPLKRVSEILKNVSEGDLTSAFDLDRDDEIGRMAKDLNNAISNLRDIMAELADATDSLYSSAGDMSGISTEMASSADDMNLQADTVAASSEQVAANVETVASATEQASASVTNISAMTDEISLTLTKMAEFAQRTSANVKDMAKSGDEIFAGVRNVAAAIEEMTTSLNDVAENTGKANRISQNASQRTQDINVRMNALLSASNQIGKVVSVIKDIADQTNMLALNATIEAAGAGEAGRGFAVVAGEVKELAKQSADATDEIAEHIRQIQKSTDGVVEAVREISKIITEIAEINEFIAASSEEQTATANEISKSVSGNAEELKIVAEKANESSKLVEEIAKATVKTSKTAKEAAMHVEEMAKGIRDVADSSGEAARGVQNISENIHGISAASKETAAGAGRTNASSRRLSEMAAALSEIVKRFKL